MDKVKLILGFSHLICAALIFLLSLPLVRGQIRMNRFYGVRTRKAFESEENWDKINRYGGRQLAIAAVILAVIGVGCCFVKVGPENGDIAIAMAFAPLVALAPAVINILRFNSKL